MNGSIVNIGVRSIEVLISIKFKKKENILTQTFEFQTSKSILKYVFDKRYEIYNKIQDKIRELLINNNLTNLIFISKEESEDKIVFTFSFFEEIDKKLISNYFFIVPSFLPPTPGCLYCQNYTNEKFCLAKNKTFLQPIKKCIIFKQKGLFKT